MGGDQACAPKSRKAGRRSGEGDSRLVCQSFYRFLQDNIDPPLPTLSLRGRGFNGLFQSAVGFFSQALGEKQDPEDRPGQSIEGFDEETESGEQAHDCGPEPDAVLKAQGGNHADQQEPENVALALGGVGLAQAVVKDTVKNIGEKTGSARAGKFFGEVKEHDQAGELDQEIEDPDRKNARPEYPDRRRVDDKNAREAKVPDPHIGRLVICFPDPGDVGANRLVHAEAEPEGERENNSPDKK